MLPMHLIDLASELSIQDESIIDHVSKSDEVENPLCLAVTSHFVRAAGLGYTGIW